MSTSVHEWFEPPHRQDLTIGPAGGWIEAAIGLLIAVGLVSFVIGAWSLFVIGAFYLTSLVTDLPFLGQFFGP
jgi:hypothetical protein